MYVIFWYFSTIFSTIFKINNIYYLKKIREIQNNSPILQILLIHSNNHTNKLRKKKKYKIYNKLYPSLRKSFYTTN